MNDLILYTSEDGKIHLNLRVDGGTVWLTQLEIAELFQTTVANINIHIGNVLREGELPKDSVIKESLITATDGRAIGKWVKKAYESSLLGATVVCLLPARTDTSWWHDYVSKGEITFLRGRLKFGGCKNPAPFPSALVVFRPAMNEERRRGMIKGNSRSAFLRG